MIFDFQSLFDKVKQLTDMAQSLRSEIAVLVDHNAKLEQRMQEAHDRVAKLIEQLPAAETDREAA
jgi:FtsZ-binding cell division protein ZapB